MKYHVRIEDRVFEVEIPDLRARPIIAIVDGTEIEVWPEGSRSGIAGGAQHPRSSTAPKPDAPAQPKPVPVPRPAPASPAAGGPGSEPDANLVRAPIPGVILSIAVEPGTKVEISQQLCILEAMKMKNVIRSPRAGTIARVHVTPGQALQHGDPIVEFEQ